jgi:hypothetical protein
MIRRKSKYEIEQSNRAKELIKKSNIFNGDLGGKLFPTDNGLVPKADYLLNSRNNLHNFMVQDVIDYFEKNEIAFWKTGITGVDEYKMPTGQCYLIPHWAYPPPLWVMLKKNSTNKKTL